MAGLPGENTVIYQGETLSFEVLGLTFKARRWGNPDGMPMLGLHGWLDNCASFDLIAPLLENVNLITLDLAGHGLTSHRSADSSYNIWEDVIEIVAIADQLGWETFSLIGHSRGAVISVLVAGTLPERVQQVVLIDGFYPPFTPSKNAPEQLKAAITEYLGNKKQTPKYHPTLKKAVESRASGKFSVSFPEAEILASRGVSQNEDGMYWWHSDRRLFLSSPMRLSRDQFMSFVHGIECPVLICLADQGIVTIVPDLIEEIPKLSTLETVTLPGYHHFHMDSAELVAERVNQFLQEQQQASLKTQS